MVTRYASSMDLSAIGNVYCLSWKAAYKDIIPGEYLDSLTPESCAPKTINPGHNLVVEDGGAVVGLANIGPARDRQMDGWGELRALYLLPDYWGKGFGKALFRYATNELSGMGYRGFYLWVLRDNLRARRFYGKMGMRSLGEERRIRILDTDITEIRYEYCFEPSKARRKR